MRKILRVLSKYVTWVSTLFTLPSTTKVLHYHNKKEKEKETLLQLEHIYNRKTSSSGWKQIINAEDDPVFWINPSFSERRGSCISLRNNEEKDLEQEDKDNDIEEDPDIELEYIYKRKTSLSGWSQFSMFDESFSVTNPEHSLPIRTTESSSAESFVCRHDSSKSL